MRWSLHERMPDDGGADRDAKTRRADAPSLVQLLAKSRKLADAVLACSPFDRIGKGEPSSRAAGKSVPLRCVADIGAPFDALERELPTPDCRQHVLFQSIRLS
jgi:hypothetical protein